MEKIFFLIVTSVLMCSSVESSTNSIIQINESTCKKKEIKIESTPFKIDLFCEDALGSYIGIVYRNVMGAAGSNGWSIEDRYWQTKEWSMDVRSLLVIDGGKNLLIATSGIYGHEGVYFLHLPEKKWERIYEPTDKKSEHIFVFRQFDEKSRKLIFQDEGNNNKNIEIVVGR